MFIAEELAIEMVRSVREPIQIIRRFDASLAEQARRAASSVPSNLGEGAQRRGKDRLQHYRIAAGSAAELKLQLRVACAWGYLDEQAIAGPMSLLTRILAITWKLTRAGA